MYYVKFLLFGLMDSLFVCYIFRCVRLYVKHTHKKKGNTYRKGANCSGIFFFSTNFST